MGFWGFSGMVIPVCRITNGGCGRKTLIVMSCHSESKEREKEAECEEFQRSEKVKSSCLETRVFYNLLCNVEVIKLEYYNEVSGEITSRLLAN
jgi:hypothetical protein